MLPHWDEPVEPVGVITVLAAQLMLGLGILMIGQRTKSKVEFYGGLAFFALTAGYFAFAFTYGGGPPFGFAAVNLLGWVYVVSRLAWIHHRRETELKAF